MNDQNQKANIDSVETSEMEKLEEEELNRQEEIEKILSSVSSYKLDTIVEKVAWLLNNYPDTRNSDITLQLKYWEHFDDSYVGNIIHTDDLYKLTRLTIIKRARAKVQNTYKLFLADETVRAHRGTLAKEEKEKASFDPLFPQIYSVYADESGKTDKYLIVGSLWILNSKETFSVVKEINALKFKEKFKEEFHFNKIDRGNLKIYKKLVDLIIKNSTFMSFKALSVEKAGISNIQNALIKLFYHLLVKGIEHENETGRAPLPRTIDFWKDAEEKGYDALLIAEVEDRLKKAEKFLFSDKLRTGTFEVANSEGNLLIQIADLFTSSVNRILNTWIDGSKPKDILADYFVKGIGLNLINPQVENDGDLGISIIL